MKKNIPNSKNTPNSKIAKATKEIQAILKKNGLIINHEIQFPIYRKLPDEVVLAMKILGKHQVKIQAVLIPIKK